MPLKAEVNPFSYELPEDMYHFSKENIIPSTCKIVFLCQLGHTISSYKAPPIKMNQVTCLTSFSVMVTHIGNACFDCNFSTKL